MIDLYGSGLGRVVRSGVRRRRVPSLVVGLSVLMAVTAGVLGGSLLVASSAPFRHAFDRQRGAQVVARFDAARAGEARIAATAHIRGVTAAAGPFPTVSVAPRGPGGLPPMTLAGRADPGGPVDAVSLTAGRWVRSPGELVLSAAGPALPVGAVLDFPGLPRLTVVGIARSVSGTADGWVEPATLGTPTGYQMLYRFAAASTGAQIAADRAAIAASVPPGALAGTQSWLAVERAADRDTSLFVPFLAAFGVLGLAMSVLVVGNVVAGTVGAGTRRIGILKALGCTPAQVIRAYAGQALVPAGVGAALGVLAGNAVAVPVLDRTDLVYGTAASGVAPWVDAAVAGGMLAVAAGAALLGAWRAGRLRTVDALAMGRAPAGGRGRLAARVAARLPVPRPVGLGLGYPFARPARAAGMLAAVTFGAVTVTFAVGLGASLDDIQAAKDHDNADVLVLTGSSSPYGPHRIVRGGTPVVPADPARIAATIAAQPGTSAYYAVAQTEVTVAGVGGAADVYAFTGDATWAGYQMVSGRWFHGRGEAVADGTLLAATGAGIGDTVILYDQGRPVPVRIVGEVFDPHTEPELLVAGSTFPGLGAGSYHIALRPGTDTAAYIRGLGAALGPYGAGVGAGDASGHSGTILAVGALTGLLTLMLVLVAGLGVLNTVVLDTRERVRDIGICKAIGMTPRQAVGMVLGSVVPAGLAGGVAGVPAGWGLHAVVIPAMGRAAGLDLPGQALHVYGAAEVAALGCGGLLIAVLGALLPATWAARARTATALRTE